MVVTAVQHQDILDYKVQQIYRGQTATVCLSKALLTADSNIDSLFATELLPDGGYTRVAIPIAESAGSYDSTTGELSLPQIIATFTASGHPVQWQSAFVLLSGSPYWGKSFTWADVNPAADTITLRAHELSNGDRLIITVEPTGVLPSGINSTTRYYVESVTPDTIKLHTTPQLNTRVDITDTGAGTFQARYANGRIAAIVVEDAPVTLLDGQSYTYQITLKEKR